MNISMQKITALSRGQFFDEIILNRDEEILYEALNGEIVSLCRALPPSLQGRAIMFLTEYAGIPIGEPLDFFKKFYKPVWTIIHHISNKFKPDLDCGPEIMKQAIKGQAMSLFLHSLDDHLNDGQVPSSHLMLLLRSAAWIRMMEAIRGISGVDEECGSIAGGLINEYYEGICPAGEYETLGDYCAGFRKEIATWYVMPLLVAKRFGGSPEFLADVKKCFGHFGIAWRILDDLNDLEEDIHGGNHTALYFPLLAEGRALWDEIGSGKPGQGTGNDLMEKISLMMCDIGIIEDLIKRIIDELDEASRIAGILEMPCLGSEYSGLMTSLKSRPIEKGK